MSSVLPSCAANTFNSYPGAGGVSFAGTMLKRQAGGTACCSQAGSTPGLNDTCSCPFDSKFLPNNSQLFRDCVAQATKKNPVCHSPVPAALPSGCAASDFPGAQIIPPVSTTFVGLISRCQAVSQGMQARCSSAAPRSLNSTVAFVNGTCGCPFNSLFNAGPTKQAAWRACVSDSGFPGETCNEFFHPKPTSSARPIRWNFAAVAVMGVILLAGAIDV
ncbi:hypothetical protein DFH06DRAFT_1148595 [Mycena polygramma]|nr:hypothetical protein DFH06DRAFT_1148595 [Mycena polygramma]